MNLTGTSGTDTRKMALCGLFAAIISVCSWVTVPMSVPFTLQTLAVFAALYILGGKLGTASVCVYISLGAIGLPVFSGFEGGVGKLFGPTGGYIFGFVLIGLTVWGAQAIFGNKPVITVAAAVIGTVFMYAVGTAWFIAGYAGGITLVQALKWCVLPFILPDLLKLGCAVLIGSRVSKMIF